MPRKMRLAVILGGFWWLQVVVSGFGVWRWFLVVAGSVRWWQVVVVSGFGVWRWFVVVRGGYR